MANSQIGRNAVVREVLAGRHISLRQGRGYIVTKLLRENETLRLIPILEFAMDIFLSSGIASPITFASDEKTLDSTLALPVSSGLRRGRAMRLNSEIVLYNKLV